MEENNEKQIKINVPAGYEIDRENSTFECIKFKKKESRFADYDGSYEMPGYFIGNTSIIRRMTETYNEPDNKNLFISEGAAKSALAFAQIGQIRKVDFDKYGIKPSYKNINVYCIDYDTQHAIIIANRSTACTRLESYLSFDTYEHAELFLKENTQLVEEYFMMD